MTNVSNSLFLTKMGGSLTCILKQLIIKRYMYTTFFSNQQHLKYAACKIMFGQYCLKFIDVKLSALTSADRIMQTCVDGHSAVFILFWSFKISDNILINQK